MKNGFNKGAAILKTFPCKHPNFISAVKHASPTFDQKDFVEGEVN